jgi:hypothetical protein
MAEAVSKLCPGIGVRFERANKTVDEDPHQGLG